MFINTPNLLLFSVVVPTFNYSKGEKTHASCSIIRVLVCVAGGSV